MEAEHPGIAHDDLWDAGDMGCGELVMHLRNRLRAMPGKVLKLVARDSGAPADIPAYCRMTGHQLLREDPASSCYWIRAKT
jgi:tRNA 2-thiouridine synthesizing protein A